MIRVQHLCTKGRRVYDSASEVEGVRSSSCRVCSASSKSEISVVDQGACLISQNHHTMMCLGYVLMVVKDDAGWPCVSDIHD